MAPGITKDKGIRYIPVGMGHSMGRLIKDHGIIGFTIRFLT